ncbi:MAG: hypothetical protein AB1736_08445 [Chloroflexota bacterium]
MRRLIFLAVVATLTLALAPTALAGAPYRVHGIQTGSFEVPAGEACSFTYSQSWVIKENYLEFGDLAADGYILWTLQFRAVHTNLDSGEWLTETGAVAEKIYPGTASERVVGTAWHLRDADGRLVTVHAGQSIIDYSGGTPVVVKLTPQMDADYWGVICTALGGSPA